MHRQNLKPAAILIILVNNYPQQVERQIIIIILIHWYLDAVVSRLHVAQRWLSHSNPSCYRQPLHQRSLNVVRQPSYAKEKATPHSDLPSCFPTSSPPAYCQTSVISYQTRSEGRQTKICPLTPFLSSTVYFSPSPTPLLVFPSPTQSSARGNTKRIA